MLEIKQLTPGTVSQLQRLALLDLGLNQNTLFKKGITNSNYNLRHRIAHATGQQVLALPPLH
jgi:hypothetical protein